MLLYEIFVAYLLCRFWSMLLMDAVPLLEADTVCLASVNSCYAVGLTARRH